MKQFLPFKRGAELFRWGPTPGRYFYVSEFEDAIFKEYQTFYKGDRWPNTVFLFKDKKMVWVSELEELRTAGKEVFMKYMVKPAVRNKLKEDWRKATKAMLAFGQKIPDLFLEDLSDGELCDLWKGLYKVIIDFWLPTIPAELGNYGSTRLLEEKLVGYIEDSGERSAVMEILTSPEKVSFYQEEEIELVKTKDIEKHAKKYSWLRNSYNGVEMLSVDFFDKRKKELDPEINKLIEERLLGIKNKKRKIIQKYKLSKQIRDITKALCEGIEWQEERKKYIFIYTSYKELLLKEVARRFNYNVDSLRNCSTRENIQILEKRGAHTLIENRANIFGFFMDPLKKDLDGEETACCWEAYSE